MVDRFADIPRAQLSEVPEDKLRTTLAMYSLGVEMMGEQLRRAHPGWSDDEIRREVGQCLRRRELDGWRDGFRVHGG